MKVRLNNAELRAAAEGVAELAEKELPVGVAFGVVRLARELKGPSEDLQTTETKILERYVERDAEGAPVPGTDEGGNPRPGTVRITDAQGFAREMEALLGTEVELEVSPMELTQLEGADVRLSPRTLLALGELLRT